MFYENTRIIVGAVAAQDEHILPCRRAIEPHRGFWTLPAGYVELNETPAAGAAITQVQILHRTRFSRHDRAPGDRRPLPDPQWSSARTGQQPAP